MPAKSDRAHSVPRILRRPARTIAILSERNLFREGILQLLRRRGHRHVLEESNLKSLLPAIRRRPIALLLVDLDHERDDPRLILRSLRKVSPTTSVVMIGTTLQSAALARAADGWLELPEANTARLERMASAVERPHRGRLSFRQSSRLVRERRLWGALTNRQQQVLELLSNGADNLKIAAELGVSERAIKAHISTLLGKFGAENRTELAVLGARAGLRGAPHAVQHEQQQR
jgi:DNA-binding NarL/FixJ family response regulator